MATIKPKNIKCYYRFFILSTDGRLKVIEHEENWYITVPKNDENPKAIEWVRQYAPENMDRTIAVDTLIMLPVFEEANI